MDKNRLVLVVAQTIMFITLAVLVGLGHDSWVMDAMTAIAGSIAGTGAYQVVKQAKQTSEATPPGV